jgi:hypothetical protein
MSTPTKRVTKRDEDNYGVLKFMREDHLQALAELRDSVAIDALKEYFNLRKFDLLKDIELMHFAPQAKGEETLFWLQDTQSKLTEGLHLLAVFERASELLSKRQK